MTENSVCNGVIYLNYQIESKFVLNAYEKIKKDKQNNLYEFWESIKTKGTPIIEEIDGDNDRVKVTFLFKIRDAEKVEVFNTFLGFDTSVNKMIRIVDTDIWHRTYIVKKGTSFIYGFLINDCLEDDLEGKLKRIVLDQFNINKFAFNRDEESSDSEELILSLMENYDDTIRGLTYVNERVPSGTIELQRFNSSTYGCVRRIWVYTPANYSANTKPLDLIVLTDGYTYLHDVKVNIIFDNMISKKLIPPAVVLFLDNQNRLEELTCSNRFGEFIASEVIPWARKRYNVSKNPDRAAIAGSSLGGLTAAYLGYCYPEIFGRVLSQSGSYWWGPEKEEQWLIKKFQSSETLPLRFYLDVGEYENMSYENKPSMVEVNEKMRDVLIYKGYSVVFNKFPGGHDYVCWKRTLIDGLIELNK